MRVTLLLIKPPNEEEEMGYFQNAHENWQDSPSSQQERECSWCGDSFVPLSPNQRRHSRPQDPACYDDHRNASMSRNGWIRRVAGCTVKEFIAIHGQESYDAL